MVSEQINFSATATQSNEQAKAHNQSDQFDYTDSPIDSFVGDATSLVNRLISNPDSSYYLHYGDITVKASVSNAVGQVSLGSN